MADFRAILDQIQADVRPDANADARHDVNSLAAHRFLDSIQLGVGQIVNVPLGQRADHIAALAEKSRAVVIVAAALDKFLLESAAELNVQAPADLGRLYDGLADLARG